MCEEGLCQGGLRKLTERFRDDNADGGEVSCGWRLQVRLHVVGGGLCAKVRLCVVGGLDKVRVGSIIIVHNLLLIPISLRLPTMMMIMVMAMMMLRSMAKVDGLVRQ